MPQQGIAMEPYLSRERCKRKFPPQKKMKEDKTPTKICNSNIYFTTENASTFQFFK